jgi:hypothetical protein
VPNEVGPAPDLAPRNTSFGNSVARLVGETESRIAPSKLPRTGDVLIGREDELAILDEAWKNSKTCIVQIVAPGGVGKT